MKDKELVKGYEVNTVTTFERIKTALIDLLRGYPIYWYYGIIETYLDKEFGNQAVETLEKDKIIEFASKQKSKELNKKLTEEQWEKLKLEGKKEPLWYRLTEKGVGVVTALINQKHSEEMKEYSQQTLKQGKRMLEYSMEMKGFTIAMIIFGALTLILTGFTLYLQFFK